MFHPSRNKDDVFFPHDPIYKILPNEIRVGFPEGEEEKTLNNIVVDLILGGLDALRREVEAQRTPMRSTSRSTVSAVRREGAQSNEKSTLDGRRASELHPQSEADSSLSNDGEASKAIITSGERTFTSLWTGVHASSSRTIQTYTPASPGPDRAPALPAAGISFLCPVDHAGISPSECLEAELPLLPPYLSATSTTTDALLRGWSTDDNHLFHTATAPPRADLVDRSMSRRAEIAENTTADASESSTVRRPATSLRPRPPAIKVSSAHSEAIHGTACSTAAVTQSVMEEIEDMDMNTVKKVLQQVCEDWGHSTSPTKGNSNHSNPEHEHRQLEIIRSCVQQWESQLRKSTNELLDTLLVLLPNVEEQLLTTYHKTSERANRTRRKKAGTSTASVSHSLDASSRLSSMTTLMNYNHNHNHHHHNGSTENSYKASVVKAESLTPEMINEMVEFCFCPITQSLFQHPVTLMSDGFTYESSAIQSWLREHERSPLTNLPLTSACIVPNLAVRTTTQQIRRILQSALAVETAAVKRSITCPLSSAKRAGSASLWQVSEAPAHIPATEIASITATEQLARLCQEVEVEGEQERRYAEVCRLLEAGADVNYAGGEGMIGPTVTYFIRSRNMPCLAAACGYALVDASQVRVSPEKDSEHGSAARRFDAPPVWQRLQRWSTGSTGQKTHRIDWTVTDTWNGLTPLHWICLEEDSEAVALMMCLFVRNTLDAGREADASSEHFPVSWTEQLYNGEDMFNVAAAHGVLSTLWYTLKQYDPNFVEQYHVSRLHSKSAMSGGNGSPTVHGPLFHSDPSLASPLDQKKKPNWPQESKGCLTGENADTVQNCLDARPLPLPSCNNEQSSQTGSEMSGGFSTFENPCTDSSCEGRSPLGVFSPSPIVLKYAPYCSDWNNVPGEDREACFLLKNGIQPDPFTIQLLRMYNAHPQAGSSASRPDPERVRELVLAGADLNYTTGCASPLSTCSSSLPGSLAASGISQGSFSSAHAIVGSPGSSHLREPLPVIEGSMLSYFVRIGDLECVAACLESPLPIDFTLESKGGVKYSPLFMLCGLPDSQKAVKGLEMFIDRLNSPKGRADVINWFAVVREGSVIPWDVEDHNDNDNSDDAGNKISFLSMVAWWGKLSCFWPVLKSRVWPFCELRGHEEYNAPTSFATTHSEARVPTTSPRSTKPNQTQYRVPFHLTKPVCRSDWESLSPEDQRYFTLVPKKSSRRGPSALSTAQPSRAEPFERTASADGQADEDHLLEHNASLRCLSPLLTESFSNRIVEDSTFQLLQLCAEATRQSHGSGESCTSFASAIQQLVESGADVSYVGPQCRVSALNTLISRMDVDAVAACLCTPQPINFSDKGALQYFSPLQLLCVVNDAGKATKMLQLIVDRVKRRLEEPKAEGGEVVQDHIDWYQGSLIGCNFFSMAKSCSRWDQFWPILKTLPEFRNQEDPTLRDSQPHLSSSFSSSSIYDD